MSETITVLKRVLQILTFRRAGEEHLPLRKIRKDKPNLFYQRLEKYLLPLDSGFQTLSHNFPILEGNAKIDILACNNLGDLIFIWTFEKLKPENLSQLIMKYDWARKNHDLWDYLFPQVKKKKTIQFKTWLICSDVDTRVRSILRYMSGMKVKIYQYSSLYKEDHSVMVLKRWDHKQTASSLPTVEIPVLEKPKVSSPKKSDLPSLWKPDMIPPLTSEEMNDLITPPEDIEMSEEDEVTDPLIPSDTLRAEEEKFLREHGSELS